MSFLRSVLRAAHCRSTHHFFALDSTLYVDTAAGQRLGNLLLKHHERYLAGAKDPDDRFRDFHNHCVHVRDGYWGGAPRLAMIWYERLRNYLISDRLSDAAYAAGVLSHYFTDPLQPLHTAQTEREPMVHRAMEWSIRCCYDEILSLWRDDELRVVYQLGEGEAWLAEAIFKGARFANHSYDRLVNTYDLERGSTNPADGLDANAKATFASLFGLAITGLARLWERVAQEAEEAKGSEIAHQGLTFEAVFATLQVPEKLLLKRIQNRQERNEVARVLDEVRRTGQVVDNIPAECFVKQQVWIVHQRELAWRQPMDEPSDRSEPISAHPPTLSFVDAQERLGETRRNADESIIQPSISSPGRKRLHRSDPIIDAPSIGPKTAARMAAIGIHDVGSFLDEDAGSLAVRLETRWITTKTIGEWQAQARLMCEVPGLLARDTQLLVGAGYRNFDQVKAGNAELIHQAITRFADTSEGRSVLRNGEVPALKLVQQWVESCLKMPAERMSA